MSPHWMPFTQMKTAALPLEVVRGEGPYLELADGRRILDGISSWWVTLFGHGQPEIAKAIGNQAQRLEQVIAAGFTHPPAQELSERLVKLLPLGLEQVFYSDDGSTSVEVALKMAYQYWRNKKAKGRNQFLALKGGYHGDTLGAMSVSDPSLFSSVFIPLLFPVTRLDCPITFEGDLEVLHNEDLAIESAKAILEAQPEAFAAIIIEPLIQGAGGMRMYRPEFLRRLERLLLEYEVLIIFDEVMTGFGRTGELFGATKAGIHPDLICLSKGLTGGFLPLAATVATNKVYEAFLGQQGTQDDPTFYHGHSFTANPLGCAAALASLDLLAGTKVYKEMESWHQKGAHLLEGNPRLERFRHMGMVGAMDWHPTEGAAYNTVDQLKAAFLERGVLLRPLGQTLYVLPPLSISQAELLWIYKKIEEVMDC